MRNRRAMLAPAARSRRRVCDTMLLPWAPARLRSMTAIESGTSAVVAAKTAMRSAKRNKRCRMCESIYLRYGAPAPRNP